MIPDQDYVPPSISIFPPTSMKICLVTGELAGPDYNGGIGTAVRGLAFALARNNYQVDILYTRVDRRKPFCFRGSFEEQVEVFRQNGVRLVTLWHDGDWNDWLAKSYQVMLHLRVHQYDLVFFNDMHGLGYYSQLARKTASSAFERTKMVVVAHSATQWVHELNQAAITSIQDLRLIEMERRSIELADVLISPSVYMLNKYRDYGWTLPANTIVLPNLLPREEQRRYPEIRRSPVAEIVFFGRLERRKGLWSFCEAINRIKHEIGDLRVTFLGKMTVEDGELTGFPLLRRSAAWPFEVQILHDFDREQALNYLKAGRRVAVMPAQQDNSPCALLECLYHGIPFIASGGSGGEELISRECWEDNLFEPTIAALIYKIRSILWNGAVTGLPATYPDQDEKTIMNWLEETIRGPQTSDSKLATPLVQDVREDQASGGHLLLVAGQEMDPIRLAASIEHIARLHSDNVMIAVLTEDRAALANRLSAHPPHAAFTIADARNFEEVVQSLAANSSIIGICHASQPITPDWLGRAELCFRKVDRIDALTGLAAGPADVPQEGWPKASDRPAGPRVRSFPMGICRLMFPLTADTNSGFVAVRPEVVEFIGDLSPLDARTGRFKRMQDWVHEIVVRLDGQGRSVELLPDCGLDGVLGDQPFTMFDSGRIARSILKSDLEYAPGSEPTLLARLAIETMTGHEMGRAAADCLSYLSDKLGQKLENASLYSTEESATRTFAAMARASGQTELAHELVVESLLPRFEKSRIRRPLASYVRRSATEIRLFDLAAAGAFAAFNLSHDWSYKVFADLREIELHPNTAREGRAGMMFSGLDLTDLGTLRGGIRLASPFSRPVRFRIDIVAVDGSSHYGLDRVVRANESLQLEERLPLEILTRCNISLFTEMANPNDQAQDAWARWTDLCLTSP